MTHGNVSTAAYVQRQEVAERRAGELTGRTLVRWQARYRDPSGKERTKRFTRKADAEKWLAEQTAVLTRGTWVAPRRRSNPLPRLRRRVARRRPQAARHDEQHRRTAPRPRRRRGGRPDPLAFGDMPLSAIRPTDVRAWVAALTGVLASSTAVLLLHAAEDPLHAESDGLIARSPCVEIDLPFEAAGRENVHFLDAAQVAALADAIGARYRPLVHTAAYTGMRAGEFDALNVDRLDLMRGRIDVFESISDVNGRLHRKPTKTDARRTVTIPPFLRDVLRDHVGGVLRSAPVFTAPEGGVMRHRNFYRRHYKPAVAAAHLPAGLRFHDLRYTHAALLVAQGAHPKELQERLGHKRIRTTLDRYGHLMPSLEEHLVDSLEAAWQQSRTTADVVAVGGGR